MEDFSLFLDDICMLDGTNRRKVTCKTHGNESFKWLTPFFGGKVKKCTCKAWLEKEKVVTLQRLLAGRVSTFIFYIRVSQEETSKFFINIANLTNSETTLRDAASFSFPHPLISPIEPR